MGTDVHVAVVVDRGAGRLLAQAESLMAELESRWSRFEPTSELTRLNEAAGQSVIVSEILFDAVDRAVASWWGTAGRFDPTVLPSLVALGYDRTFSLVGHGAPLTAELAPAPGCAHIALDREEHTVRLPAGLTLDLGGIGKGLAADRVAEDLIRAGAAGACVNVGGDVRVIGRSPDGDGWPIAIDDPLNPGRELVTVTLRSGAVTTSSRLVRCWRQGDQSVHHLIDPASGHPASSGLVGVTVVGAEAWWSEVLAKAAFVAGLVEGTLLLEEAGVTGILIEDSGRPHCLPGLAGFVS